MPPATMEKPPSKQPAPTTPNINTWLDNACVELELNGWTRSGMDDRGRLTWNDPLGVPQAPHTRVKAMENKKSDGGVEEVFQICGAPIPWEYATEEALNIQRNRDAVKAAEEVKAREARIQQAKK